MDKFRIDNDFLEDLNLIVKYANAISVGTKGRASIALGESSVIVHTKQFDVVGRYATIPEDEIDDYPAIAFSSQAFPNATAPLFITKKQGSAILSWKDRGVKRKVNLSTGKSYTEELWSRFDEEWKLDNPIALTLDVFDAIDPSFPVTEFRIKKDGLDIHQIGHEQTHSVGGVPYTRDIPDNWGDFQTGRKKPFTESSVKFQTRDFLALRKIVGTGFMLQIRDSDHPLMVEIPLEHSHFKVLISNMIFEL